MSKIRITDGKGITIIFDNGKTISIQWGPGNYGDNYSLPISTEGCKAAGEAGSTECEIAIWAGEEWFSFETETFNSNDRDVKGYAPVNEVLDWINKVRAMT